MKLVIDKVLENNDYKVTFDLVDVDVEPYAEMFKDFGIQTVSVGGSISDGTVDEESGEPNELFVLPNEYKKLPSDDFPFTKIFKTTQYNDKAEEYATAYVVEIQKRVKAITDELKGKTDTFTETTEIQL